jgi:hypothetical protein
MKAKYNNTSHLACIMTVINATTNFLQSPFYDMFENSMHDLLDMGDPVGCSTIGSEYAAYVVLNNVVSTLPTTFKYGFCMPAQCP